MTYLTERKRKSLTFNEILNQELQKQNITQRELANRTGLTEVSIGRYCNGQRSPNVNTIIKIANELHVNTDYLLGREHIESITIQNVIQKLDVLSNDTSLDINECIRYHSAKLTIQQIYDMLSHEKH